MKGAMPLRIQHGMSRLLHTYADYRIGASDEEKHCFKKSESILLTFDDYGSEQEIDELLAILAEKQTKAMIFPIGSWAESHHDLVQQLSKAGHVIGNHTYTHPNLLKLSNGQVTAEIQKGLPGQWLRAPQGRSNKRIRDLAAQLGFRLCYWTIDSRDWTGAGIDAMRYTIMTELRPGAVILFHLNGANTRTLLPSLIDDIRRSGYRLTSFDESW